MPQVQVIQPIQQQPKRLRVAAYARVSSKSADQLNSMSVQVEYYTDLIQKNPNWEFVGVYADEGISGTGLKNRAGFNHLMDDCRLGLIDRILVKSSSRMARNSVDFLSAVRELKSLGVVVEFEKERFDTDSTEGELLLGMMCAVAQEESLSISKNLRWGIRKRMESGTYHTSSVPYGYKQVNYDLVPVPNQIEIVKDIFNAFLQGESTTKIADDLNRLRPDADKHWHHTTIERILKNEKYAGCSLYQKSYTSDDLPFKRTENNGEVLSYYAPDTHNGIISQADFDKAQALLQLKSVGPCPRKDSAFSKMLYCAKCGSMLSRKINRSAQVTWICRTHLRCAADCPTPPTQEELIQYAFLTISQNISRGKRMGFSHGRFSFPYAQMLGYRKGADGQPEIIPEQAELIRIIYTSYLHGDSLQIIKSKVEAGGYKTVRGNTTWSTQALLRILQNEKYCGDVLLQKTFTDNVLTGGPKKNTGQLPQYYIENNHEGIVTKQMYREVQAEIARRNSKSCANRRKQKRGRYNSKYALSERLYCGECGSPYKRVTWNIHGRKEIVWRCVNRVTYGTKFCHNSPSVQEEVLHQTLLRAIQNLADNYTDEVAMQINGILHDLQGGTTELEELQQKLADARQEFDRLLDLSLECDASFLDEKLKHASEEIDSLQKQIDQLTASQQKAANPDLQLTVSDFHITKYSDTLVARIIERIDVVSANEIKIEFIGGYTVTAPLQS